MSLPPNYRTEVWDYKNANAEGIQKSISLFNWEKSFENLSINEKVGKGFDNISVRMIQLRGNSVTLPLAQIFKSSLSQGVFPDKRKMANIIPVHKKRRKT